MVTMRASGGNGFYLVLLDAPGVQKKSGGVSSIIFNQGAKAKLTDSTIWVSVCRVGHDL